MAIAWHWQEIHSLSLVLTTRTPKNKYEEKQWVVASTVLLIIIINTHLVSELLK